MFRADNRDDILFVTSGQTGFGYFKNFGETRRQGFELSVNGRAGARHGRRAATPSWTRPTRARRPSTARATAPTTPAGVGLEGTIEIEPGDRIPLIPAHMFKAYADIQVTAALSVDLNLIAVSSSYARGNENNRHEPDGVYYLGPGRSAGYAVVNLGGRYRVTRWLQVFAQVNNLFDPRYYTAAQLGPTGFTATGNVHRAAASRRSAASSPCGSPRSSRRARRREAGAACASRSEAATDCTEPRIAHAKGE